MVVNGSGFERKLLFLVPSTVKTIAAFKKALQEHLKSLSVQYPSHNMLTMDGYEVHDSMV